MYFEVFSGAFESQEIENMGDNEEAQKRGRGRPPKEGKSGDDWKPGQRKPESEKRPPYQPTGKPRGRPPKNPKD